MPACSRQQPPSKAELSRGEAVLKRLSKNGKAIPKCVKSCPSSQTCSGLCSKKDKNGIPTSCKCFDGDHSHEVFKLPSLKNIMDVLFRYSFFALDFVSSFLCHTCIGRIGPLSASLDVVSSKLKKPDIFDEEGRLLGGEDSLILGNGVTPNITKGGYDKCSLSGWKSSKQCDMDAKTLMR